MFKTGRSTASEPLLELDRLDAQRPAVLASRGADNEHSAYGGVLEFDVSPGSTTEIGWSSLIEGVVLDDSPGSFYETLPGVTQQMITTTEATAPNLKRSRLPTAAFF